MESIFKLNPMEIDVFLPSIKKNLQSQDENIQLRNIKSILQCFVSEEYEGRETLLVKLNKFGVMSLLLNSIYSLDDRLLPCILDLLILATDHSSFYMDGTALLAVKKLITVSFLLAKSTAKAVPILKQCISTISAILKNKLALDISLKSICRQVLYLVKVVYDSKNGKNVGLLATELLNVILAKAFIQEDVNVEILDRCLEALEFAKEIIAYKEDNVSVVRGLRTLCSTCAFGSRYCTLKKIQDSAKSTEIQLRKESLGKAICCAIINTIIPQALKLDLDSENRAEFQSNFVASLSALYNLEYCNQENLSTHLTGNGYLKYFLLLSVDCSMNLRQSICTLLSQILMNLEKITMSSGGSPKAFIQASDTIHEFLSLPLNPNDWFLPMPRRMGSGIALLTLIYHHYHGTHEAEMISYEYFAWKFATVQEHAQLSKQVLRVLWFLLAVVYTQQKMPRSEPYFSLAIKRLTSALKQSNLSDFYTHHIDLIQFCLECSEFPIDLQHAVLRLWLLQSNGDVKPLLQLNTDKVLQHCLFIALHADHNDRRLTSSVKVIRELLNENNTVKVTEITWDILPELLSSYNLEKNECLKLVLELTIVSRTNTLPMSTVQHSADMIINIVLRKPADIKLRTLLIVQARVLLDESITRNAIEVLEMYLGTHDFLVTLKNDAFPMKDLELTVACLKLSVLIVQYQQRAIALCEQPAEVKIKNVINLLFRARNIAQVRTSGLLLLLEFLKEKDDELAIRLAKINHEGEDANAIFDLLEVLFIATGKVDLEQEGLVYRCLLALFDFCHRRTKSLMHHLCTVLTTCRVIDCILEMDTVTSDFLDFVSCWLSYRARYCTTEGRWNRTSLCKTPFEETVDRIKEYMEKLDNGRLDTAHYKLRCALSEVL